jgi:hypothetical protein
VQLFVAAQVIVTWGDAASAGEACAATASGRARAAARITTRRRPRPAGRPRAGPPSGGCGTACFLNQNISIPFLPGQGGQTRRAGLTRLP